MKPRDHNPSDYAKKIKIPALVLSGKNDERVPIDEAERMANYISNLYEFHGVDEGHRPFAETHPEFCRKTVSRFLTHIADET